MEHKYKNDVNIAVIGCGYWGPNLIRNFMSIPGCKVNTVCDLQRKRLAHMETLYCGLKTTTEIETVLSDENINAVVIATPVQFHYEMAKKVLQANKHVFIEKPMASSVKQCVELIEIARENNLTLMLGHTFVYSPPVRKLKEIIESNDIGNIQYISSRRLNLGLFQTDINVAWDLAPHCISIILYILNEMPLSVNCQGKAHVNPNVEDVTNMTLNFANGEFATVQSSWLDPNKIREMTFVGSKRMVVYNDVEPIEKIKIYDKRVEVPPHYDTFCEFHYSYHHGDMYSPHVKLYEPLKEESREFVNSIHTASEPLSGGVEGLKVVQILEAASKSLKINGGPVEIEEIKINNEDEVKIAAYA